MYDFLCVSGTLAGRMTEYSDHCHEHFEEPVRISAGRYQMPTAPGYSATMKPQAIADFAFPSGAYWQSRA